MIDTAELRGLIYKRGLSQRKVAEKLGITDKTFYDKMKKAVFNSNEMDAMIDILEIDDPAEIFFKRPVA